MTEGALCFWALQFVCPAAQVVAPDLQATFSAPLSRLITTGLQTHAAEGHAHQQVTSFMGSRQQAPSLFEMLKGLPPKQTSREEYLHVQDAVSLDVQRSLRSRAQGESTTGTGRGSTPDVATPRSRGRPPRSRSATSGSLYTLTLAFFTPSQG
jgi:hypothetical protein